MSASIASKFQDHYVILGVDPKADLQAIQSAYEALLEGFRADPNGGSLDALESIELAYQVLSDPQLRREFDKVIGQNVAEPIQGFAGLEFFESLRRSGLLRSAILCVLYDRRRTTPGKPSISVRHMEAMLEASDEEITFALWYLKQRRLVASDDKSSLQITVEGMDFLEQHPPVADQVMPLIKAEAATQA